MPLLLLTLVAERPDTPLSVLGRFELTCPICRELFTTIAPTHTNTRGGVDRDLFARALGPQPEFYRISTCPRCGYSGYPADFGPDVTIPAELRERILAPEIPDEPGLRLPEDFTPASDPRELGADERYALAIQCYLWRRQSDEAVAWLYLRASWVARETGSILPQDTRLARVMRFIERWRPVMQTADNQADVEMQTATRMAEALAAGEFNRYQQPYVELALALILRRHGENRQAQPLLDRLAAHEEFPPELQEGIQRMLASIAQEQRLQVRAAEYFERALLARQVPPLNRGPACYLLGELLRRLDRDEEAAAWFRQALEAELPPGLSDWARQQMEWCSRGIEN